MTYESPSVLEELKAGPHSPDLIILPPPPGARGAKVRSFRVVSSHGQLETIIEGRGLTPERAIEQETQYFRDDDTDGETHDPYDVTFYENGMVAAVVRNFGDGKGGYKVLPIGEGWIYHVNDMNDIPDDDDDDAPAPAPGLDEDDTRGISDEALSVDEAVGMKNLRAVEHDAHARRAARPLAWKTTEGEYYGYHFPWRYSLDRVLAEVIEHYDPSGYDTAVWHGEELVAVVRKGPDGKPVAVKL